MKKYFRWYLVTILFSVIPSSFIYALKFKAPKLTERTLTLIEKTQLGPMNERSTAIEEAGITMCNQCYYTLISLLKDESPVIRKKTGLSLGLLRNKNAIPYLEKALQSEKDESVQIDFIRALGFLPDKDAAALAANYLNNASEKIRFAAAKTLTIIPDNSIYEKITAQLQAETSDVIKVLLLHAALKIKNKSEHITELVRYFYSPLKFVRLYAAHAAYDLKMKETLFDLRKALVLESEVEVRDEFHQAYNATFIR
jgi:HEAT repeat protein